MTNVSSIMTRNPVKASVSTSLREAISLMVKRNVGSIIVVDSNNIPGGIITERELLRDISDNARVSSDTPLSDIMSLAFVRINSLTPVQEAAREMTRGGVRLIVTKKNGELVGVVSTSDFLRFFSKTARDVEIEKAMNRKVVTIDASRGLLDSIKLMNEKRIGSIIVMKNGLPFGIVTERDLLRVLAKGRKKEFGSLRLEDVASRPLISAAYGITAREASSIMLGNRIKRLPLFRGERLSGIVTAKDLVNAYSASVEKRARSKAIYNIT